MKTSGPTVTIAAPSTWPGAFGLYKLSREAMLINWQTYLALLLLAMGFSIVTSAVFGSDAKSGLYGLGQIVSMLLSVYITAATTVIMFKNVQREKIAFMDSLSEALKYYVRFIVMSVLIYVALVVSLLLFIVPFFFVMPRVILAPYYLIGKDLDPIQALKASWDETKGHAGKVWGIIGVNLLIALLIITIIGIPVALYFFFMYSAASVLLYNWILTNTKKAE